MLRRLTRCSSLCGESKLKAFCFQWRVPAAPREAGALRGGLAPRPLHSSPWVGLPGPHPGFLSFHDERNQRRAGAAPLDPLRGTERKVFHFSLPLPLRQAATPSIGLSATTKDRFATLDLWANRSCFFLWFHRGNTFYFQFVARQVGCLRGYRKFYTLATNTARAQGRGIKGGRS